MESDGLNTTGIILDFHWATALWGACLRDGYASLKKGNDKKGSEKCRRSGLKQQALEMLLLYNKVYVFNDDGLDLSRLEAEGLIEWLPSMPANPWLHKPPFLHYLWDFIAASEDSGGPEFVGEEDYWDMFPSSYKEDLQFFKEGLLPFLRTEKELISGVYSCTIDATLYDICYDVLTDVTIRDSLLNVLKSDRKESNFDRAAHIMHVKYLCQRVMHDIHELRSLLGASGSLSMPVLSRRLGPIRRARKNNKRNTLIAADKEENTYRAYQILLDEVEMFPLVRSISDVLRLREDKRIDTFRTTLHEWAHCFAGGDHRGESRMRRAIHTANRDLAKVGTLKKVGRWLTYLSLPTGIASIMSGFPIGLALTPLGAGLRVAADVRERRHRWILLGR